MLTRSFRQILLSGNKNKFTGVASRCFSDKKAPESESVRNKEIEFYSNLDDWWGENCP